MRNVTWYVQCQCSHRISGKQHSWQQVPSHHMHCTVWLTLLTVLLSWLAECHAMPEGLPVLSHAT